MKYENIIENTPCVAPQNDDNNQHFNLKRINFTSNIYNNDLSVPVNSKADFRFLTLRHIGIDTNVHK